MRHGRSITTPPGSFTVPPIGMAATNSLSVSEKIWCTWPAGAYLARHGEPVSPEELTKHTCLLFRLPSSGRDRPWQFRSGKRNFSLLPESGVQLGDGEALFQAAAAGLGLVQGPTYFAEHEVKRRRLVEVLQRYRPAPLPISLVYPGHRHVPLRVRALADALGQSHGFDRG